MSGPYRTPAAQEESIDDIIVRVRGRFAEVAQELQGCPELVVGWPWGSLMSWSRAALRIDGSPWQYCSPLELCKNVGRLDKLLKRARKLKQRHDAAVRKAAAELERVARKVVL